MISVLIATRNRPEKLKECILSIIKEKEISFQIIVVDQSDNKKTADMIKGLNSNRITYLHSNNVGKANALNIAMQKSKGEIFAFTDDDCCVDRDWLAIIAKTLTNEKTISGVFGNSLPLGKKRNHICPGTFIEKRKVIITDRHAIHYQELGIGNNMAIKSQVFKDIGGFKEWLGPGVPFGCAGGEDSEMIYRALVKNHHLLHDPTMVVFHNKWLVYSDDQILQTKYSLGLAAFLGYSIMRNKDYELIKNLLLRIRERIIWRLENILRGRKENPDSSTGFEVEIVVSEIGNITLGFILGIWRFLWTDNN